jgi:hypothetical protein
MPYLQKCSVARKLQTLSHHPHSPACSQGASPACPWLQDKVAGYLVSHFIHKGILYKQMFEQAAKQTFPVLEGSQFAQVGTCCLDRGCMTATNARACLEGKQLLGTQVLVYVGGFQRCM